MKVAILVLVLVACMPLSSQSNCWRGITPLRSTCEDVKRILKVDSCSVPRSNYTLPDFRVMVEFANEDCVAEPRSWRVSKGTVVAIVVSPLKEMAPSEFGINLSKYKKSDREEIVGLEYYNSEEEGVSVHLYRGFVQHLFLYPRKADETLRCKPAR